MYEFIEVLTLPHGVIVKNRTDLESVHFESKTIIEFWVDHELVNTMLNASVDV